jgi:hypothetical protein
LCFYGQCDSANTKTTGYTSFAGGFGIIVSIVGLLALFWDRIRSAITLILDAFAALFFLAGGLVSQASIRDTCQSVYILLTMPVGDGYST